MEFVFLAAALNTLLPRIWEKRKADTRARYAINTNIQTITRLSNQLQDALGNAKFKGDGSESALNLKRRARQVSQDTRDCIQRFFKYQNASCTDFEAKTKEYSEAIQQLCERLEGHSSMASQKPQDPYVPDPMGMDEPEQELLELVRLPGRLSDVRRKVISIVGFPGLGKTLLAKRVYDEEDRTTREASPDTPDCTLRAWVTAAAKETEVVLREILKEVDPGGEHEDLDLYNLGRLLSQRLRRKRYLIVIDDMQSKEQWDGMNGAFPQGGDGDGTIIVTTSIQSVANVCSSCNGYVYKLSPLDPDKSLDLFLKGNRLWDRGSTEDNASDILNKCAGLPLAIVSMSMILQGAPMGPTIDECRAACTEIGTCLLKENVDMLKRLRWVLMNKYTGLTCDALRSCLLYYCLYKHNMDAVPRRNSLIRLWEAEGFLVEKNGCSRPTDVAAKNLETLVDCNIIQSMEVGTNGSTRRCRPTGMMVEFISQMSMSENFAALVSDTVPSGIRRLSFHPGSAIYDRTNLGMDFKIVWTLSVSGIGCEAILDFKKYDLITVLDLKGCTNLNQDHVKDICKLLLLKYLSLGETIAKIPRDIGKLELLETLEMRTTDTVKVCKEVLNLPKLKHLLGNFQLIEKLDKDLKKFLSKDSALETITGFVTTTARGFPQLMQHMKGLRKVKIFCTDESDDKQCKEDREVLPTAIKGFLGEGSNMAATGHSYSLSIDFAGCTPAPLEFLQYSGSLTSLKLRGKLGPSLGSQHFTRITGISELCLSRTCLTGEAVLAGLTNLDVLQYLKLEGDELEPIVIKEGNFTKLIRLCLVSKKRLQVMKIEAEALPRLVSFHLICKALGGGIQTSIEGLNSLKEIALDYEVHPDIKKDWKAAARGHPNRPDVLLIQNGAPIRKA